MNMKKITTLFLLLLMATTLHAQGLQPLNAAQRKVFLARINQKVNTIRTLSGAFTQVRDITFMKEKLTAKGRFYYDRQNKLRWEYLSPYSSTFVLNNGKAVARNGKQNKRLDLNSSKAFQKIAHVITQSITGENLSANKQFSVTFYRKGADYVAVLTPKDKNIKKVYKEIRLTFDDADNMVSTVVLTDPSGDTTTVSLQNVKVNASLPATLFNID